MPSEPCRFQPIKIGSAIVPVFQGCDSQTKEAQFSNQAVNCIDGTQSQITTIFNHIAEVAKVACHCDELEKVKVKIFDKCELNPNTKEIEPKFTEKEIEVPKGQKERIKLSFERVYELEALQCEEEKPCNLVVPEWWQVRVGQRSQLAIVYANLLPDGKIGKSRWAIHIPHYSGQAGVFPVLSDYQKGDYFGLITLKDNSKIYVNAVSPGEAERIARELLGYVLPSMQGDGAVHTGQRKGQNLSTARVTAISAAYYSQGQLKTTPDWIAYKEGT